ncbi:sulfatase-like hydrolase/transferase [Helicobacter ailurogastricus]|uniref:sulfatase-like hydrolase/transferase n=1 Tax=Helicobacter ailurogastricus TaxID=1578720 RepID=UPI002552C7DB|nr:sulfatase-like hydrolase/transferase [Helicobacter ailurogastricus]
MSFRVAPLPLSWGLLFYSVVSLTLFNLPLLSYVFHKGGFGVAFSVCAAYICTTNMVFAALSVFGLRVVRLFFALFSLCNALALYFISTYHVLLTKDMMGNVLHTNLEEAGGFLGGHLWVYVLLGLVVGGCFWVLPLKTSPFKHRVYFFLGSGLVFALWSATHTKEWLFFDQHAKAIGGLVSPYNYSINALRATLASLKNPELKHFALTTPKVHDRVVILAIGESARRANYSIYGYNRPTTPKLQELLNHHQILALKATSCATYTTAALACILNAKSGYENLPSFLHRQGVKVVWLSLNDGQPPMTIDWQPDKPVWQEWLKQKGVGSEILNFDEALALALPFVFSRYPSDNLFVVLHLKGSHGPLYVDKVPKNFAPFKPICTHNELNTCQTAALINAYDNTIAYNDRVLDLAVHALQHTDRQALLLYMSDHGESLGEHGLYLHGTPYLIAPVQQKQVPFIVYLNPSLKTSLQPKPTEPNYNQDVIFPSILHAFGLQASQAYDSHLDIFQ